MFCDNLKLLRTSQNLTQSELAAKLKVAPSTIGMYESGKRTPDLSTLENLAEIFSVSTDYILGRTNKKSLNELLIEDNNYISGKNSINYEDVLEYIDKHMSNLSEDQMDYFVKQVNDKYWASKNINQKNYSSRNKKNNQ